MTLQPRSWSTRAMPLMPAPPMPMKWALVTPCVSWAMTAFPSLRYARGAAAADRSEPITLAQGARAGGRRGRGSTAVTGARDGGGTAGAREMGRVTVAGRLGARETGRVAGAGRLGAREAGRVAPQPTEALARCRPWQARRACALPRAPFREQLSPCDCHAPRFASNSIETAATGGLSRAPRRPPLPRAASRVHGQVPGSAMAGGLPCRRAGAPAPVGAEGDKGSRHLRRPSANGAA